MRKNCAFIFLFLAAFLHYSFANAQTSKKYWYGGDLSLSLSKKLSISFEEQIRYEEGNKDYNQSFTEAGLKYKFNKIFYLAPSLRYSVRPEQENRRRISLDVGAKLKKKKSPFKVNLRIRYQNTTEENSNKVLTYMRHKAAATYELTSKWSTYLGSEYFFRFDRRNDWRGRRYTIGLNYQIKKRMKLNFFYRVDEDINVDDPERSHILGFGFSNDIKL